ncbi:MAG TPA: ABC transporter permease [Beutenbergiaceae bacterium]|nr:ABC transporter permease [Beutenbergiaceae bacterium]
MISVLARRLGQTVLVLFGVSIIVFSLVHITPGDAVDVMFAGENVSAEQRQTYREQLGLDQPLPQQYVTYVAGAVQGDLGTSIRRGIPVTEAVGATIPATVELTLAALVVAIIIGVPVAVVSALRQGSAVDRGGSAMALFGISMPSFWLGIMLILLFSITIDIFPASGRISLESGGLRQITGFVLVDSLLQGNFKAFSSGLLHIALPAITLGAAITATLSRVLRSGLLEVKGQDYVDALRARGLRTSKVISHMLRNAMPATVVVMGVRIGSLLGGAIVVEVVFGWPGLGRLVVDAIQNRDFPLVQGAVLVMALMFVIVNLITDLIQAWLDPRVRLTGGASQ